MQPKDFLLSQYKKTTAPCIDPLCYVSKATAKQLTLT